MDNQNNQGSNNGDNHPSSPTSSEKQSTKQSGDDGYRNYVPVTEGIPGISTTTAQGQPLGALGPKSRPRLGGDARDLPGPNEAMLSTMRPLLTEPKFRTQVRTMLEQAEQQAPMPMPYALTLTGSRSNVRSTLARITEEVHAQYGHDPAARKVFATLGTVYGMLDERPSIDNERLMLTIYVAHNKLDATLTATAVELPPGFKSLESLEAFELAQARQGTIGMPYALDAGSFGALKD